MVRSYIATEYKKIHIEFYYSWIAMFAYKIMAAITQPSPIFRILIFLGDGYDSIGSLQ